MRGAYLSFSNSVSMFAGRSTGPLAPCELHISFLKPEDHVVPVWQSASGKAIPSEEAVFSLKAVQVDDIPDLHVPSF
jgi:hypothetical protein